jgi:hypothetical protein
VSTNLILSQSTAMHFLGQADDEADAVNLTVSGWKHRGDVSRPGCGCDARRGCVCSEPQAVDYLLYGVLYHSLICRSLLFEAATGGNAN